MVRAYARQRPISTTVCKWDTAGPETFRYAFGMILLDVRKAKQIICSVPHEIVELDTSRERIVKLIGEPPVEGSVEIAIYPVAVDWKRAETADPSIPLIVAQIRLDPNSNERSTLLIDGHHRLAKAYLDNIQKLPYILLTEKESDKIQIRGLPKSRRVKI